MEPEERLIWSIRSTFCNEIYPGDDDILIDRASELVDHPGANTQDAARIFMGRRWDQVDIGALLEDTLSTAVLSPRGAAYYLPTIMMASLDSRHKGDLMGFFDRFVCDHVPGEWEPEDYKFCRENFRALLGLEQKKVVALYLEFILQRYKAGDDRFAADDVEQCLSSYWGRY